MLVQHWWIVAQTQGPHLGLLSLWITCPFCLTLMVMILTLDQWLSTLQFDSLCVYVYGWLPLAGPVWILRGPVTLGEDWF